MTVNQLLSRLHGVRRMSRGWQAHCPAHDDRSPSLSIREGERGPLIKCWAGCTFPEIVSALGLRAADLFFSPTGDGPRSVPQVGAAGPLPTPALNWRAVSNDLLYLAEAREDHAEQIRALVSGHNCGDWTEQVIEDALAAVCQIDEDERMADILRDVACNIRAIGLEDERRKESRNDDRC